MAKKLNLKIIAEGVENIETLNFLNMSECDLVQGFHLSKPLELSKAFELLADLGEQN